jgi:hypothetical protein
MTTSAFLDILMTDIIEVPSTDSTYSAHRARALRRTQQALEYFETEMDEDADWRVVVAATVTLAANSSTIATPSAFKCLMHNSGVWLQGTAEVFPVDLQRVIRAKRERLGATGQPECFAIAGQDSTTLKPLFQFDCLASRSYTIEFDYLAITPTLVDQTDATNKLDTVPNEHVTSVLFPIVQELLGRDQGDGRTVPELGPAGKAAIAQVKAHRVQKRPNYDRFGDLGLRRYGMH